ncbi:hypothetical protein MPSI1_000721 [Malassezia psittaci]|uniref:RRM domain-containing protein n=1 Tax=Malassezia psittaci TaxID=1821823 RepID=A0AAF0FBU2_9BASI|nr:hypothetical protein MPSI1_000721 [Malassezia psittaci]
MHSVERPSEFLRRTPSPTIRNTSPSFDDRVEQDRTQRWSEKNSRPSRGTQPMRDVILLGLDTDVDADQLRILVSALADAVDARLAAPPSDVTVIRDRNTGASKGFGFAKFETLEDAKRFVNMHSPFISNPEQWLGPPPGANSDNKLRRKRIKIDYSSSERPQGGLSYYEQHNAPGCKDQQRRRARRQREEQTAAEREPQVDLQNENAGLREASALVTDTLLLTGLGANASASDVAAALQTLPMYATQNMEVFTEALKQLERVVVIRDRQTNASTQQAMATFQTKEASRTCLAALRSKAMFPQGVAIGAEALRTSFADPIVLEEADPYDPTCAPWTFTDQQNRTWRHEDESLGFEVWDTSDAVPTPASTSPCTSPRSSVSLPSDALSSIITNGTTYFMPEENLTAIPQATMSPMHTALRSIDYSDTKRQICLLCQRQFRSQELLARHAVESSLHQSNLNLEEACRAGAARVQACRTHDSKENQQQLQAANVAGYSKPRVNASSTDSKRFALQSMGWNAAAQEFDPISTRYTPPMRVHGSWPHVPVHNSMPMMFPPYAIGLPDIDIAPEIYESNPAPSSKDQNPAETLDDAVESNIDGLEREPLDLSGARKHFRSNSPHIYTQDAESPLARLLRLQSEAKELEESLLMDQKSNERRNASKLLDYIEQLQTRVSTPMPPLDAKATAELIQSLGSSNGAQLDSVTPGSGTEDASNFDKSRSELALRLASLEQLIGTPDDAERVAPMMSTLARLESQIQLLAKPEQLDTIAHRAKQVTAEMERVAQTQKRFAQQENLSSETLSQVASLHALETQVAPLVPLAPALLSRLQALASLHTSTSSITSQVTELEQAQDSNRKRASELREMLAEAEQSLAKNIEVTKTNLASLETRLNAIEKRIA